MLHKIRHPSLATIKKEAVSKVRDSLFCVYGDIQNVIESREREDRMVIFEEDKEFSLLEVRVSWLF
jgi:hypothetical protein